LMTQGIHPPYLSYQQWLKSLSWLTQEHIPPYVSITCCSEHNAVSDLVSFPLQLLIFWGHGVSYCACLCNITD
jgi:hypothetical protein